MKIKQIFNFSDRESRLVHKVGQEVAQNNESREPNIENTDTRQQLTKLKDKVEGEALASMIEKLDSQKFNDRESALIQLSSHIVKSISENSNLNIVEELLKQMESLKGERLMRVDSAIQQIRVEDIKKESIENVDVVQAKRVIEKVIHMKNRKLLFSISTVLSTSDVIAKSVLEPIILSGQGGKKDSDIIIATAIAKGNIKRFAEFYNSSSHKLPDVLERMGSNAVPYICRGIFDSKLRNFISNMPINQTAQFIAGLILNYNESNEVRTEAAILYLRRPEIVSEFSNESINVLEGAIASILNRVLIDNDSATLTNRVLLAATHSPKTTKVLRKGLLHQASASTLNGSSKSTSTALLEALAIIGETEVVLSKLKQEGNSNIDEEQVLEGFHSYNYLSEVLFESGSQLSNEWPQLSSKTMSELSTYLTGLIKKNPTLITAKRLLPYTARDTESAKLVTETLMYFVNGGKESLEIFESLCKMQKRLQQCPADVYETEISGILRTANTVAIVELIKICSFETSTKDRWQNLLQDYAFNNKYDDETREAALKVVPTTITSVRDQLMKIVGSEKEDRTTRMTAMHRLLNWNLENYAVNSNEFMQFFDAISAIDDSQICENLILSFNKKDVVINPGKAILKKGIEHKNEGVRKSTLTLCSAISGDESIEIITLALKDSDPSVQEYARDVLEKKRQVVEEKK